MTTCFYTLFPISISILNMSDVKLGRTVDLKETVPK